MRRKKGDDLIEEIKLPNLLSDKQQTKVVVQISKGKFGECRWLLMNNVNNFSIFIADGLIEVFVGDSVYKPLITVVDKSPLAVQYVSFDSLESSRVLFFYECADRHTVSPAVDPPAHPLLADKSVATKDGM